MKETLLVQLNRVDDTRALLIEACRLAKVLNLQMLVTCDPALQHPAHTTFQPRIGAA